MIYEQFSETQREQLKKLASIINEHIGNGTLSQSTLALITEYLNDVSKAKPDWWILEKQANTMTNAFKVSNKYPNQKKTEDFTYSFIKDFRAKLPEVSTGEILGLRFYFGYTDTGLKVYIVPTIGKPGVQPNTHRDFGMVAGESFFVLTNGGVITDMEIVRNAIKTYKSLFSADIAFTKAVIFSSEEIKGFIDTLAAHDTMVYFRVKFGIGDVTDTTGKVYKEMLKVVLVCTNDSDNEIFTMSGANKLMNYDEGSLYPPGSLNANNSLFY